MTLEFSRIEINKLVRVKRRTIALIIERDGSLTIRAPRRVSLMEIESFVHEKTDWIIRTREKIKTIVEVPPKKYVDGDIFLFLGKEYLLHLVAPQRPALKFDDCFSLGLTAQKRGEVVFTRWYKEQAYAVISDRVKIFSDQYGFAPKRVRISSAKTRWGSCSPDGTLNFTWRLVMAPLDVVDYVVVHELVHLRVKDHSEKFWREVEKVLPEYRVQRTWLRTHGEKLTL
jgi:predicted metal-dependent hydrolase